MRPRTLAIVSFTAVALSTAGLVAVAQTSKPAEPGTTSGKKDRRDTNKDGVVSQKEKDAARERQEKRFKEADKNNDGGLSREEAKNAKGYGNVVKHFSAMDTNNDGKVTMEERRAWGEANRAKKAEAKKKAASGESSRKGGTSDGGLQPPR